MIYIKFISRSLETFRGERKFPAAFSSPKSDKALGFVNAIAIRGCCSRKLHALSTYRAPMSPKCEPYSAQGYEYSEAESHAAMPAPKVGVIIATVK